MLYIIEGIHGNHDLFLTVLKRAKVGHLESIVDSALCLINYIVLLWLDKKIKTLHHVSHIALG
jgi:hypothetical protein